MSIEMEVLTEGSIDFQKTKEFGTEILEQKFRTKN